METEQRGSEIKREPVWNLSDEQKRAQLHFCYDTDRIPHWMIVNGANHFSLTSAYELSAEIVHLMHESTEFSSSSHL